MPESLPHDAAYKEFFSNPDMVKSLVRDFIPGEFVKDFDFDKLELCGNEYITPEMGQRQDDIVWRVRWRDNWCYIYILLEFQSAQDYWMALRIAVYTGLLWQALIKSGVVKPGDMLPPVLPIVLYNGEKKWGAPTNLRSLIARPHKELVKYQLSQKYFLLDENRISDLILKKAKGEAGYIFRFEKAKNLEEIRKLYQEFLGRIPGEKFAFLRRAVGTWLRKLAQNRHFEDTDAETPEDDEDGSMLEEKFRRWEQEFMEKGFALGKNEGFTLGKNEGFNLGKNEGITLEKNKALVNLKNILLSQLRERFGEYASPWESRIRELTDIETINSLILSVLKANSPQEYEAILKSCANS